MRLINYRELIYELYTEPKLLANPPKVLGKRRHNPPRINFVKNNVPHNCVGAEIGVAGGKNAKWLWDYSEPTKLYLIDHWDESEDGNELLINPKYSYRSNSSRSDSSNQTWSRFNKRCFRV